MTCPKGAFLLLFCGLAFVKWNGIARVNKTTSMLSVQTKSIKIALSQRRAHLM